MLKARKTLHEAGRYVGLNEVSHLISLPSQPTHTEVLLRIPEG